MGISGKSALVTGGGGGVGRAFSLALAKEGVSVAVVDLDQEAAIRVAREIHANGGRAIGLRADVSRWEDVSSALRDATAEFGGVDILINNAGTRVVASLEETTDQVFDQHMNVNLRGTFYCCKAAAPVMKDRRWGRIVNISSAAGRRGHPFGGSTYAAAKAGVLGFTKSLARELAPHSITVNAIAPTMVNTHFIDAFTPEQKEKQRRLVPLGRLAEPEDLVGPMLLLVSEPGGYVTGQTLTVDGGQLMM